MRVILGADHGGFELKEKTGLWLMSEHYVVVDAGATAFVEEDDFVDYAKGAIDKIRESDDRVILFCRNGYGMSIAANRYKGVRCGVAFGVEAVRKGRSDDDINCLSIPADYVDFEEIKEMIKVFLGTAFSGREKYVRRVMKLDNINQ